MFPKNKSQKGQALVLIALGLVILLAFVALAVDGGNAFSDRRQAQNAADSAALAAAQKYTQDSSQTEAALQTLALNYANNNGYPNSLPRSTVTLLLPLPDGLSQCPPYTQNGKIFQVDIDSYNPTFFANIVGVSNIHNHVRSQVLGCGPVTEPMYLGNTIVALNKTTCKAMIFAGSSNTIITSDTNQGIYVNSNCVGSGNNDPQNSLYGGSGTVSVPAVHAVGGVYTPSVFAPTTVVTNAPTIDKGYIWPDITAMCSGLGPTVQNGSTLSPGIFPGSPNQFGNQNFPPNGVTTLNPGTYCLDRDIKITSTGATLTGTGVTIVMRSGIISIQGGNINLSAPSNSSYPYLLFYMPASNTGGSITINGGANSSYSGSILAPGAAITINGGSGTSGPFQTQLVGDTVTIGGSGTINLQYNSATQYHAVLPASLQLLR